MDRAAGDVAGNVPDKDNAAGDVGDLAPDNAGDLAMDNAGDFASCQQYKPLSRLGRRIADARALLLTQREAIRCRNIDTLEVSIPRIREAIDIVRSYKAVCAANMRGAEYQQSGVSYPRGLFAEAIAYIDAGVEELRSLQAQNRALLSAEIERQREMMRNRRAAVPGAYHSRAFPHQTPTMLIDSEV